MMTTLLRLAYAFIAVCLFVSLVRAADPIEALNEVNQRRAQRGLKPFIFDAGLTAGAMNAAQFRADRLIVGHTSNDMAALPVGVRADAAGCAAWPPSLGWGSCCSEDHYVFAGAAWAMGRDGKRYMHLFVRGSSSPTERISHVPQARIAHSPAPARRRR